MKILVLDALTQTVFVHKPFTSGIIRAALNDCYGLAAGGHEVTYAYLGEEVNDLPFKTYSLGPKGLKDYTWNNTKLSGMVMNKIKLPIIDKISKLKFDAMLIHMHSYSSYLIDMAQLFNDIPKVWMVHDYIGDKFTASNMMKRMLDIKKYDNNMVLANSEFTQFYGNHIYEARYDGIGPMVPALANLPFDQVDKFVDRAWTNFVYTTQKEALGFENQGFTINIGRYDLDKGAQRLLTMHKKNDMKLKMFGSYDRYHDEEKKYYNRLHKMQKDFPNSYELCEGFSDADLKEAAKHANNLIISCDHEGFGYTGYEMGLLGIPSIVLTRPGLNNRHATADYMKVIGAEYREVPIGDNELLFDTIRDFKLTLDEKKHLSQQFINYFTLENFVKDRELAFEQARGRKGTLQQTAVKLF